jgi:hypothetical protein
MKLKNFPIGWLTFIFLIYTLFGFFVDLSLITIEKIFFLLAGLPEVAQEVANAIIYLIGLAFSLVAAIVMMAIAGDGIGSFFLSKVMANIFKGSIILKVFIIGFFGVIMSAILDTPETLLKENKFSRFHRFLILSGTELGGFCCGLLLNFFYVKNL